MGGASTPGAVGGRCAVLLMGPTGAGKSELAVQLAQALPLEIISVDSALVYTGMDIGTAKPTRATRDSVIHHLIDIRDPAVSYSAGEFVRDAADIMQDIWRRGRQPLLVGGTMLYFNALTQGIAPLPEADPAIRAEIDAAGASIGWAAVHAQLAAVDPVAAGRIHANDPQRIQRALEVYRLTGKPISDLQRDRVLPLAGVDVCELVVSPLERSALHETIGARFEGMMKAGLLDEVRGFFERSDLSAEHTAMRAVGYRQLWRHLAGYSTLEDAKRESTAATRQLAKRQMTWLKRYYSAQWFDSMHSNVAKRVKNALTRGKVAQWL